MTPAAPDLVRAAPDSSVAAFEGAGGALGDLIYMIGVNSDPLTEEFGPLIFGEGCGLGHIWLGETGTRTLVYANFDDDAAPEFKLAIDDGDVRASEYTADDFILS